MIKKIVGASIFLAVFILGLTLFNKSSVNNKVLGAQTTNGASITKNSATLSIAEVANHANTNSCWMAIDGNVYDLTKYLNQHPGGSRILLGCGKDATTLFKGGGGHVHSGAAMAILTKYKIGKLVG